MPLGQGVARAPRDTAAAPDFTKLMAAVAPFEPQPHLAVAVSGGSDSMALTLLAHEWARACGGRITALTVDHGLRPEAAAEAAQVGDWCAARSIAHVILTRRGAAPASGVQAFARAARYALLETWCRDHFVLHLLLAHQREDQVETVTMRAARGSGIDGLAGMAAIVERDAVRLLRPLLGVSRTTLRAYLLACGQPWIEDPSNRDAAFTRVRIRAALGPSPLRPGRAFATARMAREDEMAQHVGRFVTLDPAGFATIDPLAFAAPEALASKAFGAVLATISGNDFPPRTERIERLYRALAGGAAQDRTLGGCLILRRRGKILVCRELAAIAAPQPIARGEAVRWDGRFWVALGAAAADGLTLGALGADAPMIAREQRKSAALLPAAVRATLPALRDSKGVVAVPSVGYFKGCRGEAGAAACRTEFRPARSLTGAGFTIV